MQPLTIIITNSGPGTDTPCWQEHSAAVKIAEGDLDAPTQFSYVCALDEGDQPFQDEACWPKTNPTLPGTPGAEYIAGEIAKARGLPSRRALVERLQFCIWGDVEEPWIDRDKVEAVMVDRLDDMRFDDPCFLALDLSAKRDLSAGAAVWVRPDGTFDAEIVAWTPGATLADREAAESIPYSAWSRDGHVRVLPHRNVIDYGSIAGWVVEELTRSNVLALAYDPWGMDRLDEAGVRTKRAIRRGRGLLTIPHAQGFVAGAKGMAAHLECDKRREREAVKDDRAPSLWMPRSLDAIEERIPEGRIRIAKTPLWRWAAMGAQVILDASNNRRFEKRKSTAIIDPLVALTMAVGAAEEYAGVLSRRRHVEPRRAVGTGPAPDPIRLNW